MKRTLYIGLGILCVVVGAIGIFIPVIPTTPLLLLAAYFFLRSSKKLYDWVINHPIFGHYIYAYMKFKAVSLKSKIAAWVMLWLGLGISIFLLSNIWLRVLLLSVGLGVSYHIYQLKTLSPMEELELKAGRNKKAIL